MNKKRRAGAKRRRRHAKHERDMCAWLGDHIAWWMFGGMTEADGAAYDAVRAAERRAAKTFHVEHDA